MLSSVEAMPQLIYALTDFVPHEYFINLASGKQSDMLQIPFISQSSMTSPTVWNALPPGRRMI